MVANVPITVSYTVSQKNGAKLFLS